MSRSVLSTAQVPQVHDESVATTLKVIMDVLKVRFYTGGPHKLCDRLYFEFIGAMYGNIENPRIIVLECDRYSHLTSK